MEPFIKADVFFFVTTIAIVVITLLLSLILIYGISFSRNLYLASREVRKEADAIIGVIGKLRGAVTDRGINVIGVAAKVIEAALMHAVKPSKKKTTRKKTTRTKKEK